MVETIRVQTSERIALIDLTSKIKDLVTKSAVKNGLCVVYCPHTTGAITINENADPSVKEDILKHLSKVIPHNAQYQHTEGNADAHIKSSLIGSSQLIIIRDNRLALGTWQGVFFCEFDGPRNREVWVKIITA